MAGASVVIASNRGPLSFSLGRDGEITSSRGAGGLVSAMSVAAAQGDAVWVCAALSEVDRDVAASAPGGRVDPAVRMLAIGEPILAGAYGAIANSTLWPLNHGLGQLPSFDETWRADWDRYVAYNQIFANAIADEADQGAKVLVQDYHLNLVPSALSELRPDLRIAHFTHTPWATANEFAQLPDDVAALLIAGLRDADSIGFHSPRWAANFAACAERYGGCTVPLRVHPLGVDPAPLLARAAEADVVVQRAGLRALVPGQTIISRVDRTEPAKNIHRGLLAYAELLRQHPEHAGRVVHVALAYPSRQDIAEYRDYTADCVALAAEINAEHETPDWAPVVFNVRDDYPRSLATLASAHVLLVNSLRDGMNLIAKEGVLLADNSTLVLSRETGAADEMTAAILIDPLNIEATAKALHEALTMADDERRRRHDELVQVASALPPQAWLQQQLDVLG